MKRFLKITSILASLVIVGVAFQNCAEDFDPGAYSDSNESASTGDPATSGDPAATPPPPTPVGTASCAPQTLSWPAANPRCTATTVGSASGSTLMLLDAIDGPADGTVTAKCTNGSWTITSQTCNIRYTTLPLNTCKDLVSGTGALTVTAAQYQAAIDQCTAEVNECAALAAGNPVLFQQCAAVALQCQTIAQQYSSFQQAQLCILQYGANAFK